MAGLRATDAVAVNASLLWNGTQFIVQSGKMGQGSCDAAVGIWGPQCGFRGDNNQIACEYRRPECFSL